MAADETNVYFGAGTLGTNDGSVGKVSLQGGTPHVIAGPVGALPNLVVGNKIVALLVDTKSVYAFDYFADARGERGRIRALPK